MPRSNFNARSLTILAGSLCALGLALLSAPNAQALVVDGVALAKPANSYVGSWNGSTAIAIGPRAVVTAKHVQGLVTQRFVMDGIQYAVKAIHLHPSADVQVIELAKELPGWHDIAASASGGQRVTIAGMGFTAGTETSKGYNWSTVKGETWGMNTLDTVTSWYLVTRFDASANNPAEAMFATYDSGGGIFLPQPDGSLDLAGIAVSISSSTGFAAFGDRGYSVNLVAQAAWLAQFTAPPCTGDLNGDGFVNASDFSLLINSFGTPGGGLGDIDRDGDSDQNDFNLLTSNFGTACPSAISASASVAPETSAPKSRKKKSVKAQKMPGRAIQ